MKQPPTPQTIHLTENEWSDLSSEIRMILRTNIHKHSHNAHLLCDMALVYLTEIPHAIEAIEKLINNFRQLSDGTIEVTINFTPEESSGLKEVMNCLLMEFNTTYYKGRINTNPIWASALGKVYNTVSENEHPHLRKEHFNAVVRYHINGLKNLDKPTKKFEDMLIP